MLECHANCTKVPCSLQTLPSLNALGQALKIKFLPSFYNTIMCFSHYICTAMVNGQWFIVSYDSANKQKHHKSHRMQ